jgi:uncharacterized protein HemX
MQSTPPPNVGIAYDPPLPPAIPTMMPKGQTLNAAPALIIIIVFLGIGLWYLLSHLRK